MDGAKLGSNNVKSLNNLRSGDQSLFVGLVVGGSGVSQDLFLFVEDVKLDLLGLNFGGEGVDLVGEELNFVAGVGDLVGRELDSTVVTINFG